MKNNWEIKKLGEVCDVQRGLTYSRKDAVEFSDNIVLRATNINLENSNLDFTELKYLRNDFQIKEKYRLRRNSLLICFSSGSKKHLGKIALIDDNYNHSFGGFIGQITPKKEIFSKYLFYNLISTSYKKYIIELTDGININNLKIKDLNAFQIPLPPIPEQKRIVAILDKAFSAIDKAKQNAEANLKNAKEVFESYLQNIFENKGDDWIEKKLGEVVDFFNGFAFKSKDAIEFSDTQVIRMGNLYQNKLNLNRKPAFYPENFSIDYERYILKENDLIISLTGTTGKEDYGYTVKIPKTDRILLLNQRIAKFIIKNGHIIERDFLFRFLLSRTFLDKLYKTANGTRQANLSTETMKELQISYPPLSEQKQIIQKLDALSAKTKKMENIYQQKIDDLEELRKSILQKAFNGEL
jgi:type I restriction enzyme, S subunit